LAHEDGEHLPRLPEEPVSALTGPISRFLHVEAAGGIILLTATAVALAAANSTWADAWFAIWKTPVGFEIGEFRMVHSLRHWISDGLMAVFFFIVGLEVKRELVVGELREARSAALPIVAALGGMVVPAGIYVALLAGGEGVRGWGIPMATDIAFVVGCMAILGPRVPRGLRVMLLSLAIVDDIGAILVIAVGYTEGLSVPMLLAGFGGIAFMLLLRSIGVRIVSVYVAVGVVVWFFFHESGVHATIAGVLIGLLTPARSWVSPGLLGKIVTKAGAFLAGDGTPRPGLLRQVETATRESVSPLERLEKGLHPWSSAVIMPLFALANAGVPVRLDAFGSPVALAILAGLVIGKPVGVLSFSFLAVKLGIARLPERVGWGAVTGGGLLAGIGFTMAIFIASLALDGELLEVAKIGVLGASALAAVLGMAVLRATLPDPTDDP